jgi:GrpB-like predicted nucleotidyltransferase (UPF0157 family)
VIEVVAYDPTWPARFEAIRERIAPRLADIAQSIEHVGSTAIPNLAAKPIIDIDIVVAEPRAVQAAIAVLESLGYRHKGDLGIEGREAFDRPEGTHPHHLYVCLADTAALRNHLAVRRHLLTNPAAREAYGALKLRLANEAADIDEYLYAKTDLVLTFLRAEGIDPEEIAAIEAANRAT